MEYQTLTKAELVKILEGIRSPRYGRGEPADLQNIRILEALLLERYELQAHIQSLKDSFARLDESLSDYLELFESAPVGYIVLDVGACIVKMNPSAGALLRRDRTTVVGLSFPLMLAESSRFLFGRHFLECRRVKNEVKSVAIDLFFEEATVPVVMIGCHSSIYRGMFLPRTHLP